MYKVKLSIAKDNEGCARQTPSGKAVWGNYEFYINQDVEEADFWAVYSKGERKTETCKVSPKNTVFVTGEPETVYHYSKGFIKQFDKVVVCQESIKHPNKINFQPAQPWHIGKVDDGKGNVFFQKQYDDFKKEGIPKKEKLISVISSNKVFTKGHQKRLDFVLKLKEHFGDQMDLFGRGFNEIDDKWDVIAPYKYHIVIENSNFPDYWTEKLADCYIGGAYPLYFGCTNLEKYFDNGAYSVIDINDFDKSIKIIEQVMAKNKFVENKLKITEARELVLDKYNIFQLLVDQFEQMDGSALKEQYTIKHDTAFFDFKKIQIMVISRLLNKLKRKFK